MGMLMIMFVFAVLNIINSTYIAPDFDADDVTGC